MISVRGSRELRAAVLAMKGADRAIRLDINKAARREASPDWKAALAVRAQTRLEARVILSGARVAINGRQVTLTAATSKRALSRGLVPSYEYAGAEFGMRPQQKTFEQRSRKGNRYTVTKTVGRQFRGRVKDGRIAFDAASEVGTKIVAGWVRTVVSELAAVPGVEVVR